MCNINSIFLLAINTESFFMSELFIGFLLGIIPSVSILTYTECIKKSKINKLIKLHQKTYMKPVIESLNSILVKNNLEKNDYIREFRELSSEIESLTKNIDFSLNNEYSALNSDYIFELIRTAEFTKIILIKIGKKLNYFAGIAIQREEKEIAEYMDGNLKEILKFIESNWAKNKDYIYLKRLDIFSEDN